MVGRGQEGEKYVLVRGAHRSSEPLSSPLVSAPLVASSVFTTLQVRKGCGFGVEEGLEGE